MSPTPTLTKPLLVRVREALRAVDASDVLTVAEFFRQRGVTGCPHDDEACVIANYLRQEVPDAEYSVGPGLFAGTVMIWNQNTYAFEDLPESLNNFARCFDAGVFPTLEAADRDEQVCC